MCVVIDVDSGTAMKYGEVIAALFKKGKPLPINDVWIAATVLQHGLTLVTRDNHFKEINDLKTVFW